MEGLSRRHFLKTAGAACVVPSILHAQERVADEDINTTMERIADKLCGCSVVAHVDKRLVKNPTVGCVQLEWAHFNYGLPLQEFRIVERANKQLITVFDVLQKVPHADFNALIVEGLVDGSLEERLAFYRALYRSLIIEQFTTNNRFSRSPNPPSDYTVKCEMRRIENIYKPTWQVDPGTSTIAARDILLSPVGRMGAGITYSLFHPLTILAAEDTCIYDAAEHAERSGIAEEIQRWVHDERDELNVRHVRESDRRIVYVQDGFSHDLRDDIELSNCEHPQQISHLVVTVNAIADARKAGRYAVQEKPLPPPTQTQ